MIKANIKDKNLKQIKDFFIIKARTNDIQGLKLNALYNLIQKQGEPIESDNFNNKYKGVKVLQIEKGFYIGIKRTAIKKTFYPCKLETFYCQELNN